ncbi:MAG: hypothetical protein KF683_02305 [Rubrivivax sp.]|nr:hypothetical protein [Rubrivivax sp.]
MDGNLPLILIEVVLVFGGVLAFGWWQLRDVRRAREASRRRREAEAASATGPTGCDERDEVPR